MSNMPRNVERRAKGEGRIFRPTYRDKATGEKKCVATWYIRYHDAAGKEHTESTGSRDRRVTARLLTERLHAMRHGEPGGPDVERTTFEDLAEMIRSDYTANERKSKKRMEESLAHLEAAFAGRRVITIGEDNITGYAARRLTEGAKNATVNRELACLKRMLRLGHRARRVGRLPYIAMLEEKNRRKGFFEPDQFRAVRAALPADLRALATTAYITGWRVLQNWNR
jgi:hypothetical protein